MQDYKVNLRIKNILKRICIESDYITIAAIASGLSISTKTVLREIPLVEEWLKKHGCGLDKKTGLGIRFNGSQEKKLHILTLLNDVKEDEDYSPYERRIMIICELLQNKEPVKLFNFTRTLKVTEGTVSNDLDKAEEWFVRHGLILVRKPGLGVFIEGTESNKRRAIVSLLHESVDEELLLDLIRSTSQEKEDTTIDLTFLTKTRLLNLIDNSTIKKLENIIYEVLKSMDYRLADNAFIGLIVHLSLIIKRISKKETIILSEELLIELRASEEYLIAKKLCLRVSESFSIDMPEDEIGYITMHIRGSKNHDINNKNGNKTLGNFELVRLSKEIIKIAENETGYFLEQDERLLVGLVNHLGPAINRLKMNLDIRNPLLEMIKEHYPELIKISEKCLRIVEDYLGIKMPESEIAYIAMHIGAAIENSNMLPRHIYRVVLACSSGIGTSMILASRIEKEYENIQIVDTISTLRLEEEWLREEEIEFIISTVKMEKSDIPVVTVNPLLFEEDKNKITNTIKMLQSYKTIKSGKKKKQRNLKEKLNILNAYSEGIIQILDNFFLEGDNSSLNINEIIEEISKAVSIKDTQNKEVEISSALQNREGKGSIVITGHQTVFFHSRTNAVNKLYFGAVRIKNSIYCLNGKDEQEEIKLAIVMLAPEGCSKYHIEVISYVSKMLIEKPNFLHIIKSNDFEETYNELSNILQEFYKLKVNN